MVGKSTWSVCAAIASSLLFSALALVFLSGKPLYGQGSQAITATLSGTVTDPAGLAVSGAKVTLTSPERGISWKYSTEVTGGYTFTLLPQSVYTLEVGAPGFKVYRQEGIALVAGQAATQNVSLVVGAVTQTIEVTSQAPLLNADNANISADVVGREVAELPLNFRSVISLTMLSSSVSNTAEEQVVGAPGISQSADQDISFLNFGGTFFNTAEYLLDGTWDTRVDWGGVIFVPSVDDVQEFKVQTNAFTAQYGWSSGNVVNVVTKSGSNQFHGDGFLFYLNSAMDANYFFNNAANQPKPAFTRKQFGGTIGGPIRKNKTYFFALFDGLRSATPATFVGTMPTSAQEGGDLSAFLGTTAIGTDAEGRPIYPGQIYNPFSTRPITAGTMDPVTGLTPNASGYIRDPIAGNLLTTGCGISSNPTLCPLDTVAHNFLQYYPAPTNSSLLVNNFTGAASAAAHSNEYSGRVDENFTDADRIFVRWSQKYQQKINFPTYYGASDVGGPGVVAPNNRYSADLGYNHVFSPTFNMSGNVGVNRHVEQSMSQGDGYKVSTVGLPSWIDGLSPIFPWVEVHGYSGLGAPTNLGTYLSPQTMITSSLDFTKVKGKHTLAFGAMDVSAQLDGGHVLNSEFDFDPSTTGGPNPQSPTTGTGNGFASFLLGTGVGTGTGVNAWPATHKSLFGIYLQDSWRAARKLTLNLGLRYEIQTAPTERHNAQEYFNYSATNPIQAQETGTAVPAPGEIVFSSPSHRGVYDTDYKNFAPRIGLAYQLRDKLVLRGGYGVFYVPAWYNQGDNTGYSQTTSWVNSLNGGLNPYTTLSGAAGAMCWNGTAAIPCTGAFPTGERAPTGNSLGPLTSVGYGSSGTHPIRPSPYVQQWMMGFQYSITNNDLVDISYVGNHGTNLLTGGAQWNATPDADLALGTGLLNAVPNPFYGASDMPGSSCGLNLPTVRQGQLDLPYPEYCSVYEGAGGALVGMSNYNALEATYTHRWHSGLDLNISYTYSKFLDDVQGSSGWAFPGNGNNTMDPYHFRTDYSVDVSNIPNSLVVYYTYELPFGKGKQMGAGWGQPVNAVLGGWQWSGILTAKSGLPISIGPVTGVGAGVNGFNQRPNIVPGVSPVPANQSIADWINPAAFSQPAPYTLGDCPRFLSNFHAPQYFDWDMGIQKYWNFSEHKRLQFRFEMFNALNHPDFMEPNNSLGNVGHGFGAITGAYPARSVQVAGKFYF